MLKDRQRRLIVVLSDERLKKHLHKDVKIYLKTGVSLVYGEEHFWDKLRYYLADNPRGDGQFLPLNVYKTVLAELLPKCIMDMEV